MSGNTQADEGQGLDVQRNGINAWCEANGHTLVETYSDVMTGTVDRVDRPGLAAALVTLEESAAGLVVFRLDRLARSLSVQEATLAHAWKHGGAVFSVDVGEVPRDDPDDPMRTAMRQMIGVFAQLDRAMVVARMRAGRKLKAERGGYAFGAPRFGQVAIDKALAPAPAEQETIARILELHRGGSSLREISRTLTAEGRRPKRAEHWHPKVLSRILARCDQAA